MILLHHLHQWHTILLQISLRVDMCRLSPSEQQWAMQRFWHRKCKRKSLNSVRFTAYWADTCPHWQPYEGHQSQIQQSTSSHLHHFAKRAEIWSTGDHTADPHNCYATYCSTCMCLAQVPSCTSYTSIKTKHYPNTKMRTTDQIAKCFLCVKESKLTSFQYNVSLHLVKTLHRLYFGNFCDFQTY